MTTRSGLDRDADIDPLTEATLDVLVVGAGATGAGVAVDAATRGLRVGLIDRGDIAEGTSSKSSKLIHGGLRYLANGDVAMVAEGVRERDRLRAVAPHLVRPLGFVVPTDSMADAALVGAGMVAYGMLAAGRAVASSERLSAAGVVDAAPALVRGFDAGGWQYHDAQTDDARLVLHTAMTARRHGALVVTHLGLDDIEVSPAGVRASCTDAIGGHAVELDARHVVLAGGAWADRMGGGDVGFSLTPGKGVHLTFPRSDVPVNRAIVIPSANGDGRRLFLIPWGQQTYVGTTDVPDPDGIDGASVTADDACYLLDAVNLACGTTLTLKDTCGAWAGLRPLVAAAAGSDTADLSRRHVITNPQRGVWAVTGGKLTTFRQMAEDVVDGILEADGTRRPCRTTRVPLGASGPIDAARRRVQAAGQRVGLSSRLSDTLWHRHGDRAVEVIRWCSDRDGLAVVRPGLPHLVGELSWGVEIEGARTVADVLSRRLRVSLRDAAAGASVIDDVVELLAVSAGATTLEGRDAQRFRSDVRRERGVVPLR